MPAQAVSVIGILNLTPDSFYDGGRYAGAQAIGRFEALIAEGADCVDVGAQSPRPGAAAISEEEESHRLEPFFESGPARRGVPISLDTASARVARYGVEHGVSIINDITGCRQDPEGMVGLLTEFPSVRFILMHMQGDPRTMQAAPRYGEVVADIMDFFTQRLAFLASQGIARERVILDPGIGFGKTLAHNLAIMAAVRTIKTTFGLAVLIGASRKSFIAGICPDTPVDERLGGSLAAALWCAREGVDHLRVHDVRQTVQALAVWRGIEQSLSS